MSDFLNPAPDDHFDEIDGLYRPLNFHLQQLTTASSEEILRNAKHERLITPMIQIIKDLELGSTEAEVTWATDFITGLPEAPVTPAVAAEAFFIKGNVHIAEVVDQVRQALEQ